MLERDLQRKIMTAARERGVLALKVEAVGRRGLPDLLLVGGGRTMHLEIKHPNGRGRLSALQEVMIRDLRAHGAEVHVVDDFDEALNLIEKLL